LELRAVNLPARYEELGRYPVRLALPVYFREARHPLEGGHWASASGCLLHLGQRTIGVTCRHVVEGYRECRGRSSTAVFRFGLAEFDPESYLVGESQRLDIATLDLTTFNGKPLDPASRINPVSWPPGEVCQDDILAFAGFPGIWREEVGAEHLRFYSFSSGATAVDSLADDHLYTRIKPDECVAPMGDRLEIKALGGLSGGPVFVWRTGVVLRAEFVGIVTEYQEAWDLLHVRRANCIRIDGTIME
jgi:hypothetical protein